MQVGSDEVVQFIAQKALEVIEGSGSSPMAQARPSTEALCAREVPVRAGRSQSGRSADRYPSIYILCPSPSVCTCTSCVITPLAAAV